MDAEFRQQIAKAGFKCSRKASEFCTVLRRAYGYQYNYEPARLCIARSVRDPSTAMPRRVSSNDAAAPIRGEQLFGLEHIDLWLSLVLEASEFGPVGTVADFRHTVEAHWERGASLLGDDWEAAEHDPVEFLIRLSDWLPEGSSTPRSSQHPTSTTALGAITINVGPVSTRHESDEPVDLTVNGQGAAPHIALMGKNGSGKTLTGIFMAAELHSTSGAPILILDPKGDFISGGVIKPHIQEKFPGIQGVELGVNPVPLDFLPSSDIGSVAITQAAMRFRDSLSRCFRMAGDVQQENLRQTVESVIDGSSTSGSRDLEGIRDEYEAVLHRSEKEMDSVLSKLNEICALHLFEPRLTSDEFFSNSWVIGMSKLQADEVKRLAILLILDALAAQVLSQPDSETTGGFRQLRHILFIDEARRILMEKKYQSLVDLLRQGRSKGELVMLISQDPSDFHGQADDFTSQLGTVVAFACVAHRGLRALQGAYQRKLQPAEFSDSELPFGVALVKLPGEQAQKIRCWRPRT
jgi:hypothetical protein